MAKSTRTVFEVYKDAQGDHRWRAVRKGRIVAESGEGYQRSASLRRSLTSLLDSVVAGQVEIKTLKQA